MVVQISRYTIGLLLLLAITLSTRDAHASHNSFDPYPGSLEHQQHIDRLSQPLVFDSHSNSSVQGGGDKPQGVLASDVIPWSRLAFQSYRDGNWEIYLSTSDGSQVQRLTNNTASDVQPKLNRGATKVVYSSNAAGSWDIFTVETSGANLRRLTHTAADEASPEWSPDGSAIVFSSNRDGNWEIYRMNADGGLPTRLTMSETHDAAPVWSPDGDQIAWVRRGEIYSAIWIMNADGSNQRVLRDALPFLGVIAWAPNGTRIAFDYDADWDGWAELGVFDIQANSHWVVHDPRQPLVDAWIGSWSPDGEWLVYSRLEYVVQNNQLVLDRAWLERVRWGGSAVTRVSSSGFDMEPNWQTTDVSPPNATLAPLPRYIQTSTGHIDLAWSGQDAGPAGLRYFELHAKRNNAGAWQEVIVTPETRYSYAGTLGDTYAFRVRAIDHAYNKSPWSGNNNSLVTTYVWSLGGQVVDARGIPLFDANIVVDPVGVEPVSSALDGTFTAYLKRWPPAVVTVHKPGYGSAVPTSFRTAVDAGRRWVLGPTTNAVANGAFEQSNLEPWLLTGTALPTLDRTNYHTGAGSALLRAAPGASSENLSQTQDPSSSPRIAIDATGRLHALWREERGELGLMYAVRQADGCWSAPEYLPGWVGSHDLTVTADNTVHVVYTRADTSGSGRYWIEHVSRTPAGVWTTGRNISGFFPIPSYPDIASPPFIVQDVAGRLIVAWSPSTGVWLAEKPAGQSWAAARKVIDEGTFPTPVVASDGVLHVLWLRNAAVGGDLMDSWRVPNGTWSTPDTVITGLTAMAPWPVAADGLGRLHLVVPSWEGRSLRYSQRTSAGQWSSPVTIIETPGYNSGIAIASSANGNLHLAWNSSNAINYSLGSPNSAWSQPFELARSNSGEAMSEADVVALADRSALVAWSQGPHNGNHEVMAAEVDITEPQDSGLRQMVAVPISMHKPTLSFSYALAIAETSDAVFEASVNGTTIFSATTPASQWTLGWADLTPWAGQSIAVEFHARGTTTSGPVTARMDDVAIGAWLTPVVARTSPQSAPAGSETVLTIHGENFSATPAVHLGSTPLTDVQWIDPSTVRVVVPSTIRPGAYTLRVRNPSGHEGSLATLFRVGNVVFFPLVYMKLP